MSDIHMSNPQPEAEENFEKGGLYHLVVGNEGRLTDPRRTPVRINAVHPRIASVDLQILDFEDKGAVWRVPFEEIKRYQFRKGSARADPRALLDWRETIEQLNRPLFVPAELSATHGTQRAIDAERDRALAFLRSESRFLQSQKPLLHGGRSGIPELYEDLRAFMQGNRTWDMDRVFATHFVSNPGSGELIKGHRIMLAELGLCPFEGKVVRDPRMFDEPWSREQRSRHILTRLGFMRALFSLTGHQTVPLYRAVYNEGPLRPRRNRSLVSATFSRDVAESFFNVGGEQLTAAMYRQAVPAERVFMTYLETEGLNRPYLEAEAVLIEDPANLAF